MAKTTFIVDALPGTVHLSIDAEGVGAVFCTLPPEAAERLAMTLLDRARQAKEHPNLRAP